MNEEKFRTALLQQEIEILSNKINHFDNLRWKCKQMAVLVWVAVVGFALKDTTIPINGLLLVGALLPLFFWSLEASYHAGYKGLQKRFWIIRNFLLDRKWTLNDGSIATLEDFVGEKNTSSRGKSIFPVPEFWPKYSLSPGEWEFSKKRDRVSDRVRFENPAKREPTFWASFCNIKICLFYSPLSMIAIVLLLFGKKWF